MRRLIYTVTLLALVGAQAQAQVHRTEFVSFDMREHAEHDNRAANQFYTELKGSTLDVPVLWLDRQIFLHVESPLQHQPGGTTQWTGAMAPAGRGAIMVNGHEAGVHTTCVEEFDITPWITDGANTITLPEGARAWVYSQPKLRVEDYIVDAGLDSLGKHGVLRLKIAVVNGYNFAESFNVGYDIYSPQGKLLHFDARDITVKGRGRDTLLFEQPIYGMPGNLWTAEKPNLHRCMIVVRRDKRYTEYIPFKVGFGRTEFKDEHLVRNGKVVSDKNGGGHIMIMGASSAPDKFDPPGMASKKRREETRQLLINSKKKHGISTIHVNGPQPYWFYNLADELGFYVIDEPETAADAKPNDPRQLPRFMNCAQGVFARSRNHACVSGWSLGSPFGNGYNLYKTYLWFKSQGDSRPVVHISSYAEWNSDSEAVYSVE